MWQQQSKQCLSPFIKEKLENLSLHWRPVSATKQSKWTMNWYSYTKHAHMLYYYESPQLPYLQSITSLRAWLDGKRWPHDRVNLTRLYCMFYEQDAGGQSDRAASHVRDLRRLLVMVQAQIQTLAEATCAKPRQTSSIQFLLPLNPAKPVTGWRCSVVRSWFGA